jgi:hypothetical protein
VISFINTNNYSYQVKEDEVGRVCITHGREEENKQDLVRKPAEKRSVGRPRCRWEKIFKWILQE